MKTIAAVGFELWSMQSDILFDNLIITDDKSILDQWTAQTYVVTSYLLKVDFIYLIVGF